MTIDIIQGASKKPAASRALVEVLGPLTSLSGRLFIGFPIIATSAGRYLIDALWISRDKGIVVFDLAEGADLENYDERQDDAANKIDSRLRLDQRLVRRRELRIPIHSISFAPHTVATGNGDYKIANRTSIADELAAISWPRPDPHTFEIALSTIENVSTIRQTSRKQAPPCSRGAILKKLEDSISTLDPRQSKSVIETVDGVQRIRGLAGSGKTIVLALKAAYLHAQHPEWRIAITFYTRSLKGTFMRLVRDFHIRNTGAEPDWSHLHIVNAWGSHKRGGIYSQFCRNHDVDYLNFAAAKDMFPNNPFDGACKKAIADKRRECPGYDAILVDEAQDLPLNFLNLCYVFLETPKRLIYAYDELQQLSGSSLPPPEELFGKQENGQPAVHLDRRQDIVLRTCYRNSRPVLVTAHAIGFGIYRRPLSARIRPKSPKRGLVTERTGLVQMFEHSSLWREVGYRVKSGNLEDGRDVVLHRDENTSPRFLEDHSPIEDLVQFRVFSNQEEQVEWIVEEIARNLSHDGLRHDDIIVINPDPMTTRANTGPIRRRLLESGIDCHLAGVDTDRDIFFATDWKSVTFTGVHRAKGNEAAMVYVVNAEAGIVGTHNAAAVRNRLFTAITRSKAWVRVCGVGPAMRSLKRECENLVNNEFDLRFRYPTTEERAKLRMVHRDVSRQQREDLREKNMNLRNLVDDIRAGNCHVDHLDPDVRRQLAEIFADR